MNYGPNNNSPKATGMSNILCKRLGVVFGDGVPGKGAVPLPRLINVETFCLVIAQLFPRQACARATE
jgi:hypothetical protein